MSFGFLFGAAVALFLVIGAGILSGRQIKNSSDFSVGGSAGTGMTIGALMTTLLGGSATVGTAQLAFVFGFSAIWFTLGASIGCVCIAVFTSDRIRHSNATTVGSIIGNEFGGRVRTISSLCVIVGSILNIIVQMLSGSAIMAILLPNLPAAFHIIFVALLVCLYIVFGGAKSTAIVGIVKTVLMFPAVLFCGFLAIRISGGIDQFFTLPSSQYFNLFARGAGTDLGAGISTALGIFASQPYFTAVLGAKSDKTAKRALWISACMSPLLGLGGIAVGMSMRLALSNSAIPSSSLSSIAKTAFPSFVMTNCPPLLSGLVLATLLIATAGTSAGLLLGSVTILRKDLLGRSTYKSANPEKELVYSRICILLFLAASVCLALIPTSFILDLSFLSLGLRAATALAPLLTALFFHGKVSSRTAMISLISGLLCTIVIYFTGWKIDAASAGTALSLIIMGSAVLHSRTK